MGEKVSKNFIIGTFVTLYIMVSIISTIHVVDFFQLSNPKWLAITLAIAFEIGAAASLASIIALKKMNKSIVWALFFILTAMQAMGNTYYAYKNLEDFQMWSELFGLVDYEPIFQKRVMSIVSGAILPLVALGFIKSLVDYIRPESEATESDVKEEVAEEVTNQEPTKEDDYFEPWDRYHNETMGREEPIDEFYEPINTVESNEEDDYWDEDHALDMVMNDMVSELDDQNLSDIMDETIDQTHDLDWVYDYNEIDEESKEIGFESEVEEVEPEVEETEPEVEEVETKKKNYNKIDDTIMVFKKDEN